MHEGIVYGTVAAFDPSSHQSSNIRDLVCHLVTRLSHHIYGNMLISDGSYGYPQPDFLGRCFSLKSGVALSDCLSTAAGLSGQVVSSVCPNLFIPLHAIYDHACA